jgi:integrase
MRLVKFRGRWCVTAHDPVKGTQRRSLGLPATASRQDAERAFADYRLKANKEATTVGEIMAAYLADKEGRATAYQRMLDAWKALKPEAAHFRPDQIDRQWSRDYATKRRNAGRQDGTIRRELSTLGTALRWANRNTPAMIELPPSPPPKDRVLTKAEVDRLVDAADRFHIKLAIRLMFATAARKEAILDLTWDRVDLERGQIRLAKDDGKRRKGRATVPVGPKVLALLKDAKEAALTDHVIEWAGGPVKSIRTGFASACERAGLLDVTPHVLRHSAAVALAEAGNSMAEIAQYLGHSDDRITQRVYSRYSPEYMKKLANVLD